MCTEFVIGAGHCWLVTITALYRLKWGFSYLVVASHKSECIEKKSKNRKMYYFFVWILVVTHSWALDVLCCMCAVCVCVCMSVYRMTSNNSFFVFVCSLDLVVGVCDVLDVICRRISFVLQFVEVFFLIIIKLKETNTRWIEIKLKSKPPGAVEYIFWKYTCLYLRRSLLRYVTICM